MDKHNYRLWVYSLLAVVLLAFIWGNSMLPGEVSGEISGGLMEYVGKVFSVFGDKGEFVLRKCAHFSEYAALGFFLGGAFTAGGQKGMHRLTLCLLCGLLTACADETIQIFADARGSSLIDVWIDTAGTCTGIAVHELLHWLRIRKKA